MQHKLISIVTKHYLFILILVFAISLRVYRIETLTTFGRDQGIDFLTVRDILANHKLVLIGIKVSIADFFQGPVYLYMLLPLFWLLNLNPLAGAYTAVLVSTLTLITLYTILLKFSNSKLANLTALYYATCPQLIIFGNTPLYQNFLPLFLLLTIYFLLSLDLTLSHRKNLILAFLVGLMAGISSELHFLSITLVVSIFLYLIFHSLTKINYVAVYLVGLLIGVSPTILFELKHNFLNIRLLISYLVSSQQTPLINTISIWKTKLSYLIISDNNLLIIIPAAFSFFLLLFYKNKLLKKNYINLKNFACIIVIVTSLFCLKISILGTHFFLPFLMTLILLIPIYLAYTKHQRTFFFLIGLLITVNSFVAVSQLNNNHGYFMPSGWSLEKIKQVSDIINLDTDNHQNFNVASLLDGDTRTYPLRYMLEIQGKSPGQVTAYNAGDYLYLVARNNEQEVIKSPVWEIDSFRPFRIGVRWKMDDNIVLYRLDRQ